MRSSAIIVAAKLNKTEAVNSLFCFSDVRQHVILWNFEEEQHSRFSVSVETKAPEEAEKLHAKAYHQQE